MSKELFVSSTPHETKVAVVEEDQLAEIYYERENEYTLAGSIYKGRVTRVLPGMQSAFVNIGLERDAFLYVSDFLLEEEDEAEGMEQVVARSRPVVIAEPQESGGEEQIRPLEAVEIVPPAGREAEEHTMGTEEAASEEASDEDQGGQGSRKWRGRRRRGRGRGGRSSDRDDRERPSTQPQVYQSEARVEPVHEERQERRPEPRSGFEPIVLPGESISKYGGAPATNDTLPAQTPPPVRASRPSTEYTLNPSQFSPGSMVLPGESIAKYHHEGPTATSTAAVEDHPPEPVQDFDAAVHDAPLHPLEQPREQHGHTEESLSAEATLESPQPEHHFPAAEEQIAHQDARIEQMNVAGVFGGEAVVEPADEATAAEAEQQRKASEGETSFASRSDAARQQQPWHGSAHGVVEEEEIEEEESDLPGYQEDMDLAESDELEEEVLGPGDERLVPMGRELTEAVRDAHINERATGQYEAEGLEEGADEDDEFGPASQLNTVLDEHDEDQGEDDDADEGSDEEQSEEELEGARAEHRAAAGTAGYQQPQRSDRRTPDRRGGRRTGRRMRGRRFQAPRQLPAISDLLKEGQEILVQIAKEPIAKKGARITSHIALPGRFLVYMPTVHHTGVSRKIASEEERHRLKRIVLSERGDANGGFIVRTAAASANEEDLRADIRFLINLWTEIRGRAEKSKAPALIYHDLNLVERILRDQVTSGFSAIWADTEQEYERILRFVSRFQSSLVKRVKLYTKDTPLFEQFNISDEINKALKSKVWLKSGGYIVINQTEALVAIDINTGKYVGKTARLEDTIVKTNIDAIKEIVRQIRLRDLGGIIVIDFIDMDERKNRQKVMQALEEALKADRAPSKVLQFNDFGLVAITRKRVKQSLERTLGQPCPTCQATGMIKSVTTTCNEIYVEMRKMSRHFEREAMLRVNPEVAKALKANGGKWLQEMEELTKRTILVKSDPLLHPEHFDIQ
jgi:Rne/Rng family ribonuclease